MNTPITEMSGGLKHTIDVASFATLLGAIVNFLPSIAAGLTVLWTAIRIYETETVQRLIRALLRREEG
jgi:hypothetical protein